MTASEESGGIGFTPDFIEFLRTGDAGARIGSDFERIAVGFASAMARAQAFELAAKLAEPATSAPADDDDASHEAVAVGMSRRLAGAIRALAEVLPPFDLSDLKADLRTARQNRNWLAHDFWFEALPDSMSGRADEVLERLSLIEGHFEATTGQLFDRVFESALGARGVSPEGLAQFTSGVAVTLLTQPEVLGGLNLIHDGNEVINRLAALYNIDATSEAD
jgi:hypothetical protein